MLIDFCHQSVCSRIKADKVAFDGYEVENLLSGDVNRKQKGFLSDHFVKPPVNVTVQFPCNVAISRIVLDPVIGQQKSCDIKIFTASEKIVDSWLYSESASNIMKTDGLLFSCVGSVSQKDPKTLCFINRQFQNRGNWSDTEMLDVNSFPCAAVLNSRKPGSLRNVSHVTISIVRTKDSKAAALRRLEVWGMPATAVPLPIENRLKNVYIESMKQKIPQLRHLEKKPCAHVQESEETSDKIIIDSIEIPEDFIDPLTFEIMTVPILLPSGKHIDEQSLNRYVNTEASWGRPPSDPFTGVPFSTGKGPLTDASLKARIDQFVLKHSDTLRVPRTLGHSKNSIKSVQSSTEVSSRLVFSDSAKTVEDGDSEVVIIDDDDITTSVKTNKRDRHAVTAADSEKSCKKQKTEVASVVQSDYGQSDKRLVSAKLDMHPCDHKSSLSRSLDAALYSALGNLPSFSKSKSVNSEDFQNIGSVCCLCEKSLVQVETVKYRIPCGHIVCRSCLIMGDTVTCGKCNRHCKSSEAIRVF